MTDFDCTEPSCTTPTVCLEANRCCALSPVERNETARRDRVKQLIDDTRKRLREGSK